MSWIQSGPLFLLKDHHGCFIVVYMEHVTMFIRRDIKSLSLPEIKTLRYSKALLFSDDAELARIANCMDFCMKKTLPSKYICTGNFLNIIGTMWTHHFVSCLTMITCSKTIFFPGMPLSGICYLTAWGSLVTTPFDWIPI